MASREIGTQSSDRTTGFARVIAVLGGISFVGLGIWAMVAPSAFFEAVARFEPYNKHFLQDIGAFQIGLGVVLLLAAIHADALAVALVGVGVGASLHTISHVIDRDLGGNPATDIPTFTLISILLLAAGLVHWGRGRGPAR